MAAGRILIADPDADSRTVFRIVLEHGGFEVRECARSDEALEQVREWDPQVMLLELTLPPADGYALMKAVLEVARPETGTGGPRVVVLTARAVIAEEERALAAGCHVFLTKPIQPRRLLREVERVMKGA